MREGGKQRVACWILAAKASLNKGNKLQLHLQQGLKVSPHIKLSLIWKKQKVRDIGRSDGGMS